MVQGTAAAAADVQMYDLQHRCLDSKGPVVELPAATRRDVCCDLYLDSNSCKRHMIQGSTVTQWLSYDMQHTDAGDHSLLSMAVHKVSNPDLLTGAVNLQSQHEQLAAGWTATSYETVQQVCINALESMLLTCHEDGFCISAALEKFCLSSHFSLTLGTANSALCAAERAVPAQGSIHTSSAQAKLTVSQKNSWICKLAYM